MKLRHLLAATLIAGTAICLFGWIGFLNPLSVGVSIGSAAWTVYEDRKISDRVRREGH